MSIPTDFFLAEEAELDLAVDGPADRFPTVQTNGVDPVKLATLNGILTGRDYSLEGSFDGLLHEVKLVRVEGDEGPWIFAVPTSSPQRSATRPIDASRRSPSSGPRPRVEARGSPRR